MQVTLITHTPDPVPTVAAAAKLCYSPSDPETLLEGLTKEKAESFVEMLRSMGHESPFEHASFTFGVSGVSRALLAQVTRHRIASFSVQSQRYVDKGSFEYIVPPEIQNLPEARAEFLRCMEACEESYQKIGALLSEHYLSEHEGSTDAESRAAHKRAIEDARFVLPNACDTKLMMTINARSLQNFFAHRLCTRAQWEIRALADKMLELVQEVAPALFSGMGPPCVRGNCPEGKVTCGRMAEQRARYGGEVR